MNIFHLGFWLPRSLVQRYPQNEGAGQLWEGRFLQYLGSDAKLRIASIVDRKLSLSDEERSNPEHLLLQGRFGKDLQAYPSFCELRKEYLGWRKQGWKPDCFIVYNSHPIGNAFTRFLAKHDPDVRRVLLFLDSRYFSKNLKLLKRLRLKLEPLHWRDEVMLPYFHGVASASLSSERFCSERNIPWHWFPGGAQSDGLLDDTQDPAAEGPKKIGYFGSHSDYAGLRELIEAFLANPRLPLQLSIAGAGSQTERLKQQAASDPRIAWVGFFDGRKDLGRWASSCHVLVNPRPAGYGNENNFPSKVFDYVQLGRPVLSSLTPTLKHAFRDLVMWYDADNPHALSEALAGVAQKSVAELGKEGADLRNTCAASFFWEERVRNLKQWMHQIR
jgi:glycosyltransferase involved in cell wall biosynthesis